NGILKSEDQGETWFPLLTTINSYSDGFRDGFMFNADSGIFVGTGGHMLYTNDGGRSFRDVQWASNTLNCISFLNDSLGIAGGYGVLMTTKDSGKTWKSIDINQFGVSLVISRAKFITPMVAYASLTNGF